MRALRDTLRDAGPPGALIALAAFLRLPLAAAPLHLDDCMQRAMIAARYPATRSLFALYSFMSEGERRAFVETGAMAWWTSPRFRLVMMRPLSSLLVALDAHLPAPNAALAHLHSFVWFALWAAATAALYRRVLGPRVALVALALLLCDDGATIPLVWVANRCFFVAAFFATLSVHGYLAWWARGGARRLAPVVAWAVLALAAGEYALPVLAAIPAHALTARRDGRGRAPRVLAGSTLALVAYALTRALWGAGVRACGLYPDPLVHPLRFAAQLPLTLLALVADVAGGMSVDVTWATPLGLAASLGALVLALVALLSRGVWSSLDPRPRRAARWAVVWCAAALVPAAATWLNSRMMAAPTVASSVVWALALGACAAAWRSSRRVMAAALAATIAAVHGAGALVQTAQAQVMVMERAVASQRTAAMLLRDAPVAPGGRLVVINAIDIETLVFGRYERRYRGLATPARWHVLASTPTPVRVTRVGPDAIELSHPRSLLEGVGARWFNDGVERLRPGAAVAVTGMRVEVVAATAAGPSRLRVRFDRSVDDPSITLAVALSDGLHRVHAPAVGESIEAPIGFPIGR